MVISLFHDVNYIMTNTLLISPCQSKSPNTSAAQWNAPTYNTPHYQLQSGLCAPLIMHIDDTMLSVDCLYH